MGQFRIVSSERYEDIKDYLYYMYQVSDMTFPLAFVDVDNTSYMITKLEDDLEDGDKYAICYKDDNNEVKIVGYFEDDESYSINCGDVAYRISNSGTVVMEDQNSKFKQQLTCCPTLESNPKISFNYTQEDPYNRRDLYMHYIVDGYGNPDMALPYLKNKYANEIILSKYGLLVKYHDKKLALYEDRYYRYYRLNNDMIFLLPIVKNYDKEEYMNYLASLGFNRAIPDELVSLYQHNNSKVRSLKYVADEYKKNTNL